MFNHIPKKLNLPDIGIIVLVYHQQLPEKDTTIEACTGYWDGRFFHRLTYKDDPGSVIRHPMGWEEIQPSEAAKAALKQIETEP